MGLPQAVEGPLSPGANASQAGRSPSRGLPGPGGGTESQVPGSACGSPQGGGSKRLLCERLDLFQKLSRVAGLPSITSPRTGFLGEERRGQATPRCPLSGSYHSYPEVPLPVAASANGQLLGEAGEEEEGGGGPRGGSWARCRGSARQEALRGGGERGHPSRGEPHLWPFRP